MVIYAPLSLVLSTLYKRSQELKQSQGSQLGVWVRGYEGHKLAGGNLLSQIAKLADRSFADRVVLPVTAAIYRNGEEKPAMYSELPTMSQPLSAQLTKSKVQQMKDWRIKHGQSVAQKNGETHEYKRQPRYSANKSLFNRAAYKSAIWFRYIGEVQRETTETVVTARRERGRNKGSSDLLQSSSDIRETKIHVYAKRQTWISTTWPSFSLNCRSLFITSTQKWVASRQFYP